MIIPYSLKYVKQAAIRKLILTATVEGMTLLQLITRKTTYVVERVSKSRYVQVFRTQRGVVPPRTAAVSRVLKCSTQCQLRKLALFIVSMLVGIALMGFELNQPVYADEQPSQDPTLQQVTVTNNITDTGNLLGANVGMVSDTITATEQETGVSVRLLYIDSFSGGVSPEKWASSVLESTKPKPNTVLLAVASKDGNLVVAVSANSDPWLKNQKTVDELSDTALKPLVNEKSPNWSGSAVDMMNQIVTLKKTSTSGVFSTTGTVLFILAVAVLLGIVGVRTIWVKKGKSSKARRRGKRPTGVSLRDNIVRVIPFTKSQARRARKNKPGSVRQSEGHHESHSGLGDDVEFQAERTKAVSHRRAPSNTSGIHSVRHKHKVMSSEGLSEGVNDEKKLHDA